MATNCDNVIDLSPAKTTWKIKVKIIRLWRQYSAGDIDSIEMVLIDSNVSCFGITIQFYMSIVIMQPLFKCIGVYMVIIIRMTGGYDSSNSE